MYCYCKCSVPLPYGAMGWSAVCDVVFPDHTHFFHMAMSLLCSSLSPNKISDLFCSILSMSCDIKQRDKCISRISYGAYFGPYSLNMAILFMSRDQIYFMPF